MNCRDEWMSLVTRPVPVNFFSAVDYVDERDAAAILLVDGLLDDGFVNQAVRRTGSGQE